MLKCLLSLPSDLDDMCDKAVFKHTSKLSSIKKPSWRYNTALTHAGKHLIFVLPPVPINTPRVTCNYQTYQLSPRMLKIFFVTKWSVTFLCQNIILYMYIEKHEKKPQQIFSQMPSAKRRNAQNKKYCNPFQHYEVNLLSAVSSDSAQIPILRRKKTSGKQKNCHTISYNLIKRKNMLKIMSTKGYDHDHFNEINMPSYP